MWFCGHAKFEFSSTNTKLILMHHKISIINTEVTSNNNVCIRSTHLLEDTRHILMFKDLLGFLFAFLQQLANRGRVPLQKNYTVQTDDWQSKAAFASKRNNAKFIRPCSRSLRRFLKGQIWNVQISWLFWLCRNEVIPALHLTGFTCSPQPYWFNLDRNAELSQARTSLKNI